MLASRGWRGGVFQIVQSSGLEKSSSLSLLPVIQEFTWTTGSRELLIKCAAGLENVGI